MLFHEGLRDELRRKVPHPRTKEDKNRVKYVLMAARQAEEEKQPQEQESELLFLGLLLFLCLASCHQNILHPVLIFLSPKVGHLASKLISQPFMKGHSHKLPMTLRQKRKSGGIPATSVDLVPL
ncbi:unnamed protein product [Microthlaspi erraticum]|uniref:Uncharacterized protein n=1 Tax=Microthlaspi erraticum TaxID=1685480 RepID=A0A6D2K759_9BRAS|nr:unnamed protein product [Microthlaspi erraticum]CAA7049978.1 unnamed protein product [Microthlaspi erraticum]